MHVSATYALFVFCVCKDVVVTVICAAWAKEMEGEGGETIRGGGGWVKHCRSVTVT